MKIRTAAVNTLMIAAGVAGIASAGLPHAHASAAPDRLPCAYVIHLAELPHGRTDVRIAGSCHGHAPTAWDVKRMARTLVNPEWLRVGRYTRDHGGCVVVYGGSGDTSAKVCADGTAFTS